MAGSFISDTLTLNGLTCDMNKYNKKTKLNNENDNNGLVIIGKGIRHYSYNDHDDDEKVFLLYFLICLIFLFVINILIRPRMIWI